MPKTISKEAIEEFRKSKGMTQPEFADYMGVSVWTVRAWQRDTGYNKPPKWLLDDPRTKHLAK